MIISAILLISIAACFLAPLWIPLFMAHAQLSFFPTPDSMILLGLTLTVGFLAQYFLPYRAVQAVETAGEWVKQRLWVAACSFILLLAGLIWINGHILHSFMNSADEHSCYFLAECIRMGKLWAIPHSLSDFFEVVHVGNRAGKWFSVYPLGWPLVFAFARQFNLGDWANPLQAILAAFLFYHIGKKIFGFASAFLGTGLMIITPFFLLNNASYFSHTTCLLSIAAFLFAYLKWKERQSSAWAFLCAFAAGYGLNTRYLTMAAILIPFVFYELGLVITKRERWNKSHAIFSVVLVISVAANLYYNYLITGNFLEAPNHYYHGWERLWFHRNYTFFDALKFVLARFFSLMDWTPPILLIIYLIGLLQFRKGTAVQLLFRFGFLYFPFAYIFYYSWGGNQYGPRYYFEGLPFLTIAASETICFWWKSGKEGAKKILVGALFLSVVGSAYQLIKHSVFYETISRERKAFYVLAEQGVKKPAVVYIRGFLGDTLVMAEEDAVRNHPGLREPILYAHDLGIRNAELVRFYPDRHHYLGSFDRKSKKAVLQELTV